MEEDAILNDSSQLVQQQSPLTRADFNSTQSNVMSILGYKETTNKKLTNNSVTSLGVDYSKDINDSDNYKKLNDAWVRANHYNPSDNPDITSPYYNRTSDAGIGSEVESYCRSFAQGTLDFYSLYDDNLSKLNTLASGVSPESQDIYNAIITGNYGQFNKDNKYDILNEAKEFTEMLWQSVTPYDRKFNDGEKRMLPIRLSMDEVNEGYKNKYANSNYQKYGIIYKKGSELKYADNFDPNTANEDERWIYEYVKNTGVDDGDGVGWIFIPQRARQYTGLVALSQLADVRANDYTDTSKYNKTVSNKYALPVNNDIKSPESHYTYSLLRNLNIFYNEWSFPGINAFPDGAETTVKPQIEAAKSLYGFISKGRMDYDDSELNKRLSGINRLMPKSIELGDKINKHITAVNDAYSKLDDAYSDVATTAWSFETINQPIIKEVTGKGYMKDSDAASLINALTKSEDILYKTDYTNMPITTYVTDENGHYKPMTNEQKLIMQKALQSSFDESSKPSHGIVTTSEYRDGTNMYYSVGVKNKKLAQVMGLPISAMKGNKTSQNYVVEAENANEVKTIDSGAIPLSRKIEKGDKSIVNNFDLDGVTTFLIPVTAIDDNKFMDAGQVASNELQMFGKQYGNMQLLKNTFFGDLQILSKNPKTSNDRFYIGYNGKQNQSNNAAGDIIDDIVINNKNHDIERLMMSAREYQAIETILKAYSYGYSKNVPNGDMVDFIGNYMPNRFRKEYLEAAKSLIKVVGDLTTYNTVNGNPEKIFSDEQYENFLVNFLKNVHNEFPDLADELAAEYVY